MGSATISDIVWKGYGMRGHRYRVTVEHLGTPRAGMDRQPELVFETVNHDEIIAIVQRMRASGHYSEDEAASLGLGLKLFSEVMLKHRDDPLFAALRPAVRSFIGALKARLRGGSEPALG